MDPFVIQAAVIAHPAGIDAVVFAGLVALHHLLASAHDNVAASAAARADALRFFQEPDSHLEAKIFRGERAYGANIDGVERVVVIELPVWESSNRVVTAAVHNPERIV